MKVFITESYREKTKNNRSVMKHNDIEVSTMPIGECVNVLVNTYKKEILEMVNPELLNLNVRRVIVKVDFPNRLDYLEKFDMTVFVNVVGEGHNARDYEISHHRRSETSNFILAKKILDFVIEKTGCKIAVPNIVEEAVNKCVSQIKKYALEAYEWDMEQPFEAGDKGLVQQGLYEAVEQLNVLIEKKGV